MTRKTALLLSLVTALIVAEPLPAAQTTTAPGAGIAKPGKVSLKARSSVASQDAIAYMDAHMVTDTGAVLDADQIKAFLVKTPTGTGVDKVVATGHVKALIDQAETGRKYTVYADKGVYDPKLNQIDLTGSVRIEIVSSATTGPLVQTGTEAIVKLGPAPAYPIINMSDVETTFSLAQ